MELYSSKYLNKAANELSKLPGIGKKTALRLALHLLRQDEEKVTALSHSLLEMKLNIKFCKHCHNIADQEVCELCNNPKRNNGQLCIVEDINDVIAIEKTGEFFGRYHILGGLISPMDGVGPQELNFSNLSQRINEENINEIILALSSTVEGDTTNFYIYRKHHSEDLKISMIARGIGIGDEIEYIDEITLGKSISYRKPYDEAQ